MQEKGVWEVSFGHFGMVRENDKGVVWGFVCLFPPPHCGFDAHFRIFVFVFVFLQQRNDRRFW